MPRVFIPGVDLKSSSLTIDGPDFHHLFRVLRVKLGEEVTVLDNHGSARKGTVVQTERASMVVEMGSPVELPPEPATQAIVAQALGKGDKFEQVIQHGTEVGAHAFIPVITARTVVKIDASNSADKVERWGKVAKGAAEQCGRGRISEVLAPVLLQELCSEFGEYDAAYLCQQNGENLSGEVVGFKRVLIVVGPEGGFTPDEVAMAVNSGARTVSLGPYTLRTETAAFVALSRLIL